MKQNTEKESSPITEITLRVRAKLFLKNKILGFETIFRLKIYKFRELKQCFTSSISRDD